MRKTRLAAAGAAAAIALGGTVAAASTTGEQTVTITVEAAPLTLSLNASPDVTFTPNVGATDLELEDTTTQLTYHNPTGSDTATAKVTVARSGQGLLDPSLEGSGRNLTLTVQVKEETVQGTPELKRTWSDDQVTTQDLITEIGRNGSAQTDAEVTVGLAGDAGNAEATVTSTLTYTIVAE